MNSATKNTDQTEGIYEDASSDIKSKQQGSVLGGSLQGGLLDRVAGSTGGQSALGYDAKHGSSVTGTAENKAQELYDDARQGAQSAGDSASHHLQDLKGTVQHAAGQSSVGGGSAGGSLLDTVRDKVSGVFGGAHTSTESRQASTFDAGASSATKNTDLTDGIHEDASKGIESVTGATARRD
jgi:hypothetical protein